MLIYPWYVSVVRGEDNRQKVKIMRTESKSQIIQVFLPRRHHDITPNHGERGAFEN